jgi:hypothetical protein
MCQRRRYITPGEDAQVWCHGRWGPRRVRVTQCWAVVAAEELYTTLLKHDQGSVHPGACGRVTAAFSTGHLVTASWECARAASGIYGRIFLTCDRCSRRCTRLYRPVEQAPLACRTCWGLSYESRTRFNYKDTLYGRGALARMLGTTQREIARISTLRKRNERLARARERWLSRSVSLGPG